jgi:hypothetical protein
VLSIGLYRLLKNSILMTSGAKALTEKKRFIAALKAVRHPKSSFSATLLSLEDLLSAEC